MDAAPGSENPFAEAPLGTEKQMEWRQNPPISRKWRLYLLLMASGVGFVVGSAPGWYRWALVGQLGLTAVCMAAIWPYSLNQKRRWSQVRLAAALAVGVGIVLIKGVFNWADQLDGVSRPSPSPTLSDEEPKRIAA